MIKCRFLFNVLLHNFLLFFLCLRTNFIFIVRKYFYLDIVLNDFAFIVLTRKLPPQRCFIFWLSWLNRARALNSLFYWLFVKIALIEIGGGRSWWHRIFCFSFFFFFFFLLLVLFAFIIYHFCSIGAFLYLTMTYGYYGSLSFNYVGS